MTSDFLFLFFCCTSLHSKTGRWERQAGKFKNTYFKMKFLNQSGTFSNMKLNTKETGTKYYQAKHQAYRDYLSTVFGEM